MKAGFTLLEVLAAVALLGILYTVLARVAIVALRAEGESNRRLAASLIADTKLTEGFTDATGAAVMPPVGHSEMTEGDYRLALDVSLFQPPAEWAINAVEGPPAQVFAEGPGGPGAQLLRTVQLTVSWLEGSEERHVSRTFFLVDLARVGALAAQSKRAPASPSGEAEIEEPDAAELPSELELP